MPNADDVVAGAPKAEVVVAAGVLPNAEVPEPEPSAEVCPKDELPNTDAAGFPKAELAPRTEGWPNADVVVVAAGVPNADGVLLPKAPEPEPEAVPNADGVDVEAPKAPPPPNAPLVEPKAEEVEGKADDDDDAPNADVVGAAERTLLCFTACWCSA